MLAYMIAGIVAQNCSEGDQQNCWNERDRPAGGQDAGTEQQGIAWKKEAYHHAGFGKNNERDKQQPATLNEIRNVKHVYVCYQTFAVSVQPERCYTGWYKGKRGESMSDDVFTLVLEPRELTGKSVKRLREAGTVPAVIHDHGKASVNVQAPYLEIYRTYVRAGKHHPVQLVAGSKKYTALIKSATFEPKKNMLTHIVFNAVNRNQKVEAEVPIRARYAEGEDSTPAERASLIVLEQLTSIEIRAVPDRIPDVLEYDAAKLVNDGDQVTVADLIIPQGVELADTELTEHPVATVVTPAALEAANNALAGEATAVDAQTVASEEGSPEDDAATQDGEIRTGGKREKEDSNQAKSPEKR